MQPLVMEQNVFEYKDLSDLGAFWQSRKIRLRHKEQNDWLESSSQAKESALKRSFEARNQLSGKRKTMSRCKDKMS